MCEDMGNSPGHRLADLVELDGVEPLMAEEDVEHAVALNPWAQRHGLTAQGLAEVELASFEADPAAALHAANVVRRRRGARTPS